MSVQRFTLHAGDNNRATVLANAIAFIGRLLDSKPWVIEIRQYVKPRSKDQNAALFAVAEKTLADFLGYQGAEDMEQLHRGLCGMFFGTRVDALGIVRPKRTTTKNEAGERDVISTAKAAEFYAFIQQLAAEHGCFIPDPDPFWREKR